MGEKLSEAWLWLLLAFILGLVIGYFLTKLAGRDRTAADRTATSRITELEAQLEECKSSAAKPAISPAQVVNASAPVATKAPTTKPAATKAPAARKPAGKTAALDLAAGKAALGTTVKLDDLKLIEGIGPKIEALIKADGLTTWRQLSKANVERLQGILDAAGPRYNIHNPGSWPMQAGLLADGKWAEFKTLADNLKGGT